MSVQTEQDQQDAVAVQETAIEVPAASPPPVVNKKKDNMRFTKKRRWKKWVFLGVIVVAVGGTVFYKTMIQKPPLPMAQTMPLSKGDISNVVGLDGVVQSALDAQVYPSQSGMVQTVNVKVGDQVEAGQILAQLDTEDLQLQITEQQARINLGAKKNDFALEGAEKTLSDGRVDIAAGLNSSLISADSSLNRAQQELNAARRDYTDEKESHELADIEMNAARKLLDRAWDKWKQLDEDFQKGVNGVTQEMVDAAEREYLDALDDYNKKDTEYGADISTEGRRLREARIAYQDALDNRNATKNAVQRSIENLEREIQSTELASDMTLERLALQRLNKQLGDSAITAPISGTITAVYAEEGAPASGMLFIIEDTENMVIKTAVKEYDVNLVKVGMPVTVKSDATGEEEYEGKVEQIYPTASKDAKGETTAAKVEYETDVALVTQDSGLRVGMNVRLGVTTAEKKNVFSVPFDSVVTGPDGNDIIYIAETNAEGKTFVKSIPVTTGLETDFELEVTGEGLTDGMLVITDLTGITEGMEIASPIPSGAAGDGAGAGNAPTAGVVMVG